MVVGSLGVEVMMLTLKIRQIYIYIYSEGDGKWDPLSFGPLLLRCR